MTCGHRTVAVSNEIGAIAGISQVIPEGAGPVKTNGCVVWFIL